MTQTNRRRRSTTWSPLPRTALEILLRDQSYTHMHLTILAWLIWLPLLSPRELLRMLTQQRPSLSSLSTHLERMQELGLIEQVVLHENRRERRYYATDLGLYLYVSAVKTTPPITIARLAASYPVTREDLLRRLARPAVHLTCMALISHLVQEGAARGYMLDSYQQPWQHDYQFARKNERLAGDAALLLLQSSRRSYAFLIHVDSGKNERATERWLLALLDLRQQIRLYRQSWPALLIIAPADRIPLWSRLLPEVSFSRVTTPLIGGIISQEALEKGNWWRLETLGTQTAPISFWQLLHEPVGSDLVEHISRRRHFLQMRFKDTAMVPRRTGTRLVRYVGDSLTRDVQQFEQARLQSLFASHHYSNESIQGAGLLTLALTRMEKDLLRWIGKHPLLDLPTLQAILCPQAESIKPLQRHMSHLLTLGLAETRLWSRGKTVLEQERYLLTTVGLKFLALRAAEPYRFYLIPRAYQKGDDAQLDRQWGTRGLAAQMWHTHGLYTFMQKLYLMADQRGELIYEWKSAHEAARWYRDSITQESQHTRPDAEVRFALSTKEQTVTMVLLEYDRGTTSARDYRRKFSAYLDYKQAAQRELPLLVVTVSSRALALIKRVLEEMAGELHAALVLERDLLSHGFALIISHFTAGKDQER